jgi:sarcosine oxidase
VTARTPYDAIVVGVGTIGSAAAYHLARRNVRVLGLEQFSIVHDRGSMHGATRIIRLAYHEDPRYVALVRRAYELWRELEQASGERLLHLTGSLDLGPEDGAIVAGALRACREHELAHELLTAKELERRYPAWRLPPDAVAVLQPDGGLLEAERSVQAQASAARAAGADLHEHEPVLEWDADGDGVRVRTTRATYEAARLVLCPGAWAPSLLRVAAPVLFVERQVVAWFEAGDDFAPARFPVFVADDGGNYYGIPAHAGRGVKVGRMHHPGTIVDPDRNDPRVSDEEVEVLERFVRERLPGADRLVEASPCLFTTTPDRNFVLDLHPSAPNVVIASVCSGHGFKFAPVAGEILADLALDGDTRHPIDFLRLTRF